MERYSKSVAGGNAPNAKCGPMKNAQMAFHGDMFAPSASQICQNKISEVLWTYISVLSFVLQCNL